MNMWQQRILITVFASMLLGATATVRADIPPSVVAEQVVSAEQHQPPAKHKGAKKRWKKMTPEQRAKAREHYRRFRQLPPEEQARIRERYEHFKELPPEQRKELREQWKNMSPEERRALSKKHSERRLQKNEKRPQAQSQPAGE